MGIKERREREKDKRRESILCAAMALFMDEGYHNTTMDKIAERAELGRATLYLHFKTKDEIFVYAVIVFVKYFGDLLEDIYKHREQLENSLLKEVWDSCKKFYYKDPVTFSAILYFHQGEMMRKLPKKLRTMLMKSGSRNFRLLSAIIEYGIKQGIFLDCNPKTLAEVIWTSFMGIMHLENSKEAIGKKNHREITTDVAFEVLARGIIKQP